MMLYDPKKADLFYQGVSLREFTAWLETMPPNQPYEFLFALTCAIAQFLKSKGVAPKDQIVDFGSSPGNPGKSSRGEWLYQIVGPRPHTFGAALERARAIQP